MCEALMEIMKEDIDEKVNEGRIEGRNEGRIEGRNEGRIEGRIEGRSEGENRLGSLITKLIALGRNQDIDQAAKDPAFREKLYKEFQIA